MSLAELGIELDGLDFQPVGAVIQAHIKTDSAAPHWPPAKLTIPEAKKALAATFGVKPEAVEISIRG